MMVVMKALVTIIIAAAVLLTCCSSCCSASARSSSRFSSDSDLRRRITLLEDKLLSRSSSHPQSQSRPSSRPPISTTSRYDAAFAGKAWHPHLDEWWRRGVELQAVVNNENDNEIKENKNVNAMVKQDTRRAFRKYETEVGVWMGAAISVPTLLYAADRDMYAAVATREFGLCTPENSMKFDAIEPQRGQFAFERGDHLMDWARDHLMRVRGHVLVWHQQLPNWLCDGIVQVPEWGYHYCNATSLDSAQLLAAMRDHVRAAASHYGNLTRFHTIAHASIPVMYCWDVVNEAVSQGAGYGTEPLSSLWPTIWERAFGEQYVDIAFMYARLYAHPRQKLFYNDFGMSYNTHVSAVYEFVKGLVERRVPIDGVGFQMHVNVFQNDFNAVDLERNIRKFTDDLGLLVHITEMDVRVTDGNPAVNNSLSTAEKLQRQTNIYRDVLRVCLKVDRCEAFVTWGFTDRYTWLPEGLPLPFASDYAPKPAVQAMDEQLHAYAEANPPTSPGDEGGDPDGDRPSGKRPLPWFFIVFVVLLLAAMATFVVYRHVWPCFARRFLSMRHRRLDQSNGDEPDSNSVSMVSGGGLGGAFLHEPSIERMDNGSSSGGDDAVNAETRGDGGLAHDGTAAVAVNADTYTMDVRDSVLLDRASTRRASDASSSFLDEDDEEDVDEEDEAGLSDVDLDDDGEVDNANGNSNSNDNNNDDEDDELLNEDDLDDLEMFMIAKDDAVWDANKAAAKRRARERRQQSKEARIRSKKRKRKVKNKKVLAAARVRVRKEQQRLLAAQTKALRRRRANQSGDDDANSNKDNNYLLLDKVMQFMLERDEGMDVVFLDTPLPQTFLFGTKKVQMAILGGGDVGVRVGGGFVPLDKFVQVQQPKELRALVNRVYRQLIKKRAVRKVSVTALTQLPFRASGSLTAAEREAAAAAAAAHSRSQSRKSAQLASQLASQWDKPTASFKQKQQGVEQQQQQQQQQLLSAQQAAHDRAWR